MIAFLKESWKIALWMVVAGFGMTFLISIGRPWSASIFWTVGSFTSVMWMFLWIGNAYLANWIDHKISWHEKPMLRLGVGIAAMLVYTIGSVYFLIVFYRLVFNFSVASDMSGMLYTTVIITTIISMFMTSRSFLINWRQSAIDVEASKREIIKAQYDSLKSQVNPHFLFNSLNALTNLVYEDQDKAALFIRQLSEVYRYVLDTRDKEVVALEDELKFLESYLFLQKIRFGNNLAVEINLDIQGKLIAPLALQLLVENAIKHNIASSDNPLFIEITEREGYIVVENSLQRKNMPEEKSPGIGLENIKSRYKFLSDHPVVVDVSKDKFVVKLPLIESDER
jgi:sensor histidine kinase YesM